MRWSCSSLHSSGCAPTSHSEGSRAELYDSIEELAADSTLVVTVTATADVETAKDPQLMTGTQVVVDESLSPKGLPGGGTNADSPAMVTVWQLGDANSSGPLPLIQEGKRYLLFLVSTGLDKPSGGYFITGSSAGYWVAEGDGFIRPVEEGDNLPKAVVLDDLK